ncbi:MAG: D-alanyl-D-alanine carboxypeptidase [Clostridia bacterium]|nr:D-alanyl-D-alanine carboxypeptidase [Clostridia bacterium]
MRNVIMCLSIMFLAVCSEYIAEASPSVSARAAIVIENSSGKIIYEKNPYEKLPMASTTKIMTALCAIENSFPDMYVSIDDSAVGIEGSSVYLTHGEIMTIRDLLYATMLASGNDAATAIAIEISGSVGEFAKLMNETAQKIGATDTNFVNACGLYEDNHYTTAYDLAIISAYAMENQIFSEIVSTKSATIPGADNGSCRVLKNHNKLLSLYDGCIGVKTGYTKKCGRCLVSCAQRNGVTLTCVTLNAPDDWNDHIKLLDYGFSNVKMNRVVCGGQYALSVNVKNSYSAVQPLMFEEDLSYISTSSESESPEIEYVIDNIIKAPLDIGDAVGEARLCINGVVVDSSKLICKERVDIVREKAFGDVFIHNINMMSCVF